jgi:hypothetical protein
MGAVGTTVMVLTAFILVELVSRGWTKKYSIRKQSSTVLKSIKKRSESLRRRDREGVKG